MKTAAAFLAGLFLAFAPMAHAGGALDLLLGTTGTGSTPASVSLDYAGTAAGWYAPSIGYVGPSYTTGAVSASQDVIVGISTWYPYASSGTYLNPPSGWSQVCCNAASGDFSIAVNALSNYTAGGTVIYNPPLTCSGGGYPFCNTGGGINVVAFKNTSGSAVSLGNVAGALSFNTTAASPSGNTIVAVFCAYNDTSGSSVTDQVGNAYTSISYWNLAPSQSCTVWAAYNALALPPGDTITFTAPGGTADGNEVAALSIP